MVRLARNQMKYIYDVRRSSSISQRHPLNFVGMRSKSCVELNQYNVTDLSQLGIYEGCQRDPSLTNNLTLINQGNEKPRFLTRSVTIDFGILRKIKGEKENSTMAEENEDTDSSIDSLSISGSEYSVESFVESEEDLSIQRQSTISSSDISFSSSIDRLCSSEDSAESFVASEEDLSIQSQSIISSSDISFSSSIDSLCSSEDSSHNFVRSATEIDEQYTGSNTKYSNQFDDTHYDSLVYLFNSEENLLKKYENEIAYKEIKSHEDSSASSNKS